MGRPGASARHAPHHPGPIKAPAPQSPMFHVERPCIWRFRNSGKFKYTPQFCMLPFASLGYSCSLWHWSRACRGASRCRTPEERCRSSVLAVSRIGLSRPRNGEAFAKAEVGAMRRAAPGPQNRKSGSLLFRPAFTFSSTSSFLQRRRIRIGQLEIPVSLFPIRGWSWGPRVQVRGFCPRAPLPVLEQTRLWNLLPSPPPAPGLRVRHGSAHCYRLSPPAVRLSGASFPHRRLDA